MGPSSTPPGVGVGETGEKAGRRGGRRRKTETEMARGLVEEVESVEVANVGQEEGSVKIEKMNARKEIQRENKSDDNELDKRGRHAGSCTPLSSRTKKTTSNQIFLKCSFRFSESLCLTKNLNFARLFN